jgi:hypothetical protein
MTAPRAAALQSASAGTHGDLAWVEGRPGPSPSAVDRVISDEQNAHAGLLLTPARFFEQARIKFQCSNMFA